MVIISVGGLFKDWVELVWSRLSLMDILTTIIRLLKFNIFSRCITSNCYATALKLYTHVHVSHCKASIAEDTLKFNNTDKVMPLFQLSNS